MASVEGFATKFVRLWLYNWKQNCVMNTRSRNKICQTNMRVYYVTLCKSCWAPKLLSIMHTFTWHAIWVQQIVTATVIGFLSSHCYCSNVSQGVDQNDDIYLHSSIKVTWLSISFIKHEDISNFCHSMCIFIIRRTVFKYSTLSLRVSCLTPKVKEKLHLL